MPAKQTGHAKEISPDEKVQLVLEGMREAQNITELCRKAGISRQCFNIWSEEFIKAGTRGLAVEGDTRSESDQLPQLVETDLLQSIVESSPANFLMSRLSDGKVLFRSPSSKAMYGNPSHTRDHWVSQEAREQFIDRIKHDGEVSNMFFMARGKDGRTFPAQVSSRLVQHHGEDVILSTSADLTNVYALRAERERADARLRDAIDTMGEGFVLFDEDDGFVMANQRYREMLSPYAHLLKSGTHITQIIGSAMQEGHIRFSPMPEHGIMNMLQSIKHGEPFQTEAHFADGTQKIVNLSRLRDGGLAATFFDITTRREAETLAKEMMNDVIQSLDEGLSLYDSDLRFVMRNGRRYEMLTEHEHDIPVGQHLTDVTRFLASSGKIVLRDDETPEQWSDYIVGQTKNCTKNIEIEGTDGRQYLLSVHRTKLGGYLLVFKDVTEERRAEQAQREADALLKTVIEACPANFLMSRISDGEVLFRSQASAELFGEKASARGHWNDPKDRKRYLELLEKDAKVDNLFVHGLKADGTSFPSQVSARIVEHKGEKVIVSSTTDLTEAYSLREELEQANARFHEALEAFDEGFVLWDSDLRLVMRNERLNEMFNMNNASPVPGQSLRESLHRQIANDAYKLPPGSSEEQVLDDWINSIKTYKKGVELQFSDGRIMVCSTHKTELNGYLCTVRDVTEQRKAEAAEREADTLLKLIVEACPVNFMVSRVEDGNIIYRSQASKTRFGKIDSARSFFLKPEDRLTYLDTLLPTGVVDDYPVKFRKGDGSIMDGLTSARVTNYKGDDVIVSSTRDVTDFLKLQDELRHQREIAHQNEKLSAMGELLAGVAHELNNPLSVVVGYALMLQEKLDDPVHRKRVKRIGQSADRCAKIVKTFLAMARQRPANLDQVSLNEVLEIAFDLVGYDTRSNAARIVFDLDSTLPAVMGDADQLVQVFSNLITNAGHAISHLGEGGVLTLKTYFDDTLQRVVAEVTDNGVGIPPEDQPRIFEPFFTTKDAGDGTGIGLAFCYRIIDTHGGRLSVKSKPAQGSRFIVRMKQSEHLSQLSASPQLAKEVSRGKRVMVVDDEEDVADMLRDILEHSGHHVEIHNDAKVALNKLASETFDAILCDIKMPGMGGTEFRDRLVASNPEQAKRLAFVSGDILSTHVSTYLNSNDVRFLEKPVIPVELLNLVEKLCAGDGSNTS